MEPKRKSKLSTSFIVIEQCIINVTDAKPLDIRQNDFAEAKFAL